MKQNNVSGSSFWMARGSPYIVLPILSEKHGISD